MLEKLVFVLAGMKTRAVTSALVTVFGILTAAGVMSEDIAASLAEWFGANWSWIGLAIPAIYQLLRELTYESGSIAKKAGM